MCEILISYLKEQKDVDVNEMETTDSQMTIFLVRLFYSFNLFTYPAYFVCDYHACAVFV